MTSFDIQDRLRKLLAARERNPGDSAVACLGPHVPLELPLALGLDPVVLPFGGSPTALDASDTLVRQDACPLCRSRVGDALRRRDLLDRFPTILHFHACEQDGRAAECIAAESGLEIISVALPRTRSTNARKRYAEELANLAARLSHRHGVAVDPGALPEAVDRVERLRELLRDARPSFSFPEFARLIFDLLFVGIGAAVDLLETLDCSERRSGKTPLFLAGSCTSRDDLVFARDLLDEGADIVDDATPSIGGFLDTRIPPETSSWEALASAHFDRPDVAARPNDAWHDWIQNKKKAADPAGVIYRALRFCDVHSGEQFRVKKATVPLPFLFLDDEFDASARPRRRTRIAAFLEMIRCRAE